MARRPSTRPGPIRRVHSRRNDSALSSRCSTWSYRFFATGIRIPTTIVITKPALSNPNQIGKIAKNQPTICPGQDAHAVLIRVVVAIGAVDALRQPRLRRRLDRQQSPHIRQPFLAIGNRPFAGEDAIRKIGRLPGEMIRVRHLDLAHLAPLRHPDPGIEMEIIALLDSDHPLGADDAIRVRVVALEADDELR